MNADFSFKIGKQHSICQDYARVDPDKNYVILSDGCSASPDSDFGARLLVQSAIRRIDEVELAVIAAQTAAANLGLDPYAIDATLLFAKADDGKINVSVYGDGVVAARRLEDKTLDVFHLEYPSGYPQYLSYSLSKERQALLQKVAGDNKPTVTRWFFNGEDYKQVDNLDWNGSPFVFSTDEYDVVAIFSDGVNSFIDEQCQPINWQKIVYQMMDFGPSLKGQFIQRQLNWMGKQISQKKWQHLDDLTMGAIHTEK